MPVDISFRFVDVSFRCAFLTEALKLPLFSRYKANDLVSTIADKGYALTQPRGPSTNNLLRHLFNHRTIFEP